MLKGSNNLNVVSKNEDSLIKKVLNRYDFEVVNYKKTNNSYKIHTKTGDICLKKFKHGLYKVENKNILITELLKNSFKNTPRFIKTKNNNLFIFYKKRFFYATEWIQGNKCNLLALDEAKNCAKLLAQFHVATKFIDKTNIKLKANLKNWPQLYKDKSYDLFKFKDVILNKRIKDDFDKTYLRNIDKFYEKGLVTLKILNDSDYYRLSKKAKVERTICYNSFYYENIIKKDNMYYIINLDNILIDMQINDLCKFIKRLMNTIEYNWDFQKAKEIIYGYNSIKKLRKGELYVMLAFIIFPYEFWKIGKNKYYKYKNWNEQKYSYKLNEILKKAKVKENFIKDYLDFLDSYTN